MTHNTNKTIILIIIYRQQTVAGVTDPHLEQIVLKFLFGQDQKLNEEVTSNANELSF